MTALYQLAAEYRQAAAHLVEMDLDEVTIADTLESMTGDVETKVVSTVMVARGLIETADSIQKAREGMQARENAFRARAVYLLDYAMDNMLACNISKIESPYFGLSVRENPASVVIDCAAEIPADYFRQPETPPPAVDKKLIAQAIKDGFDVPGAHVERQKRLVIK